MNECKLRDFGEDLIICHIKRCFVNLLHHLQLGLRFPVKCCKTRKLGFTLAEVLITLGIIGIVAAMTMPTLVQNYKRRVVETKLQKVYSLMNQAIKLSTVDNGETKTWEGLGNNSATYEDTLAWFNKYLAPYLKYTKVKQYETTKHILVYFADGTAIRVPNSGGDFMYFIEPKCLDKDKCQFGVHVFQFRLSPKELTNAQKNDLRFKYTVNPGFEPYAYAWDGTIEGAKHVSPQFNSVAYGCYDEGTANAGLLCTKLIQLNHWKIPDDYPHKF